MIETHKNVRTADQISKEACPALADNLLMRIGDKWTVKVVVAISQGSMRYSQIFKRVGSVSQRMLTLTLKNLERDGLVTRTVYPTIPPRVDYELTELGQTLVVPLNALWNWVQSNHPEIEDSRLAFDQRHQQDDAL